MRKMTNCLWFDDQAEEAARFYTSIFPNSKIETTTRYSAEAAKVSGRPEGSVMTVTFELEGNKFMGLNGGPVFQFSEAVSFMVPCRDQKEIDFFWDKLTADGGQPGQCGWLKDRFGVSWQVVPGNMEEIMKQGDTEGQRRVMAVLLTMTKLDVAALRRAAEGAQ